MVRKKKKRQEDVFGWRDVSLAVAVGKIVVSMVILLGMLIILDIFVYLGVAGDTYADEVEAAYDNGYNNGYSKTYEIGYQEAHTDAYDRGYARGYEISQASGTHSKVETVVILRIPEYTELKEFLDADKTDLNPYKSDEYSCFDFAAELNNNAEAAGIRAAYVRINSDKWAHALVAFETLDRGLVFIEPQSDREVKLIIGKSYPWWMAGANSPLRSSAIIEEILIIW